MQLLSHLRLWQKQALLGAAMAVPAVLLAALYFSSVNSSVNLARRELAGANYSQAVGALLAELFNHRGRAYLWRSGNASMADPVAASESTLDKLGAAVDAQDVEWGSTFGTSERWRAIKAEWSALKGRIPGDSPEQVIADHGELIRHIEELARSVARGSGLDVDPDPTSAMLVELATKRVFASLRDLGNMRMVAVHAAANQTLSGVDRAGIELRRDDLLESFRQLESDLPLLAEENRTAVQAASAKASAAFNDYLKSIDEKILSAHAITASASDTYKSAHDAWVGMTELSSVVYARMDATIQNRLAADERARLLAAAVVVLASAVALVLALLITRALTGPMARAIGIFGRIAAGQYDNAIGKTGRDETGQVLRALDDMQGRLRVQIESERAAAAANGRIKTGLDKASASVMLTDETLKVIYVNEAAQALFQLNQADFRRDIPALDAQRIVGSNLGDLYGQASSARASLAGLSGTQQSDIDLGGHAMRVSATPVLADNGARIGTIVEWWDRTQEVRAEEEVGVIVRKALDGDLAGRVKLAGKTGFFQTLAGGINQLLDNVGEIVSRVQGACAEVLRGAEEISAGNANLSQRTEEQSSSLEETASSMEEMTSTVKQNADNASQANQLAMAARAEAEKGGAVVNRAVQAMTDINESSQRISAIIGVIDEIAFQTNLLALNAAVEAARAGEQGRGFAVVASEVRGLAGRSATAAKEIKELIQDSVKKVEDGSTLVGNSGRTLAGIVSSVKKVSDIIAEIAAASREQSSGIEQVNKAVMQMDEMTQQNAALVEEAAAASQSMAQQARSLSESMDRYRISDSATSTAVTAAAVAPTIRSGASGSVTALPRKAG